MDLRHAEKTQLDSMEAELREACVRFEETRGVRIEMNCVTDYPPLAFDDGLVAGSRKATLHLGYRHMDIVSGAGHDARYVALDRLGAG